mmetsp:Transcript_19528/g.31996  ORF Transcript_19528/g.31996 Transcript_19528/m.31996 type:complete len:362 (+) Transcript_19528:2446-3531(+)
MDVHINESRKSHNAVARAIIPTPQRNTSLSRSKEGLNEQLGALDVGEEGHREVDGPPAREIPSAHEGCRAAEQIARGEVDDHVYGVFEQGLGLIAVVATAVGVAAVQVDAHGFSGAAFVHAIDVDLGWDVVFGKEVSGARGGEQGEAHGVELAGRVDKLELLFVGADGHQDVLLGHHKPGRQQCLDVCLVLVSTKACDLPGGGHLHSQHRVGACESGEGELRCLDTNIVEVGDAVAGHARYPQSYNHPRCHLCQVDVERLGHKRERPGCAQIALDDLDFVVFRNELTIERARHIERVGNLPRRIFHLTNGLLVQVLGREDNGGITRMDPRVLHMLRYAVHHQLSIARNCINLYLLGLHDEL